MSDTPETDAFVANMAEQFVDPAWVEFSHELERERNDALKALKHIEEYGTKEINESVTLRQELAKALLERDELNGALSSAVEALQLIGTTVKFWEKESVAK